METIGLVGALMGLAFTSGLRLYSTVLAIGLGIRLGYLRVPPDLAQLQVLAATPVLIVAGGLYTVEFLADKIPWVDTIWDAVHTFIRPIGAALLAATAVGHIDPVFKVAVALMCGSVALSSHAAKAGVRILANHSPEPFTNIGLSLGEDVGVVGGVWLAFSHPLISLAVVTVAVVLTMWLVPKLIRLFRAQADRLRAAVSARVDRQSTLR